jgi:aerobic-type carbon monoxide dehydrogenase small subunit (CoxS/CutS family)
VTGERKPRKGFTRRQFLAGVGAGAAAAGLPLKVAVGAGENEDGIPSLGPGPVPIDFTLNGQKTRMTVAPNRTLLDALRDDLAVTGPKRVCDRGACGACTVLLDGVPVNACMTLAVEAAGRKIVTVEGLSPKEGLSDLQANFVKRDALQCGFCTPGMVTSCEALLAKNPKPDLEEVKQALSGNLCRCGTYPRIFQAVLDTAKGR